MSDNRDHSLAYLLLLIAALGSCNACNHSQEALEKIDKLSERMAAQNEKASKNDPGPRP